MMDLSHSLQQQDAGFLRIVAEGWGLELEVSTAAAGRASLIPMLLDRQLAGEVVAALPTAAQAALGELQQHGGAMSWSQFTRRHGEVREMGPGRRDRERPDQNPVSAAEWLWYRALVGRAFRDTPAGPQEFVFIPDDLLELMPDLTQPQASLPGRPATAKERAFSIAASDRILDYACTLLAALRMSLDLTGREFTAAAWDASTYPLVPTPDALRKLLQAAELIDESTALPDPETAPHFLASSRPKALAALARAWMHSAVFNDLRLLPGLVAEGEWQNDPLQARYFLLDYLKSIPHGSWWSLDSLLNSLKQSNPDFQRPAGDYDSWFIRPADDTEFLRGFAHWDRIDGALVRFIISGPLHWLGLIDLAAPAPGSPPTAFRFTAWAEDLLDGAPPANLPAEDETLLVSSDARLRAPRLVPRLARYQAARFCQWERSDEQVYAYRLTPASLARARQQGLHTSHLLKLLQRHALAVPPALVKALQRWERHGSEAHIEPALILRLRSPELLKELRQSRAARFLGDPLGPTTIVVKSGAWQKVIAILAEMGYLAEADVESW